MCDRDGTIALLDQMVGTTTKATARAVAAPSVNPAAHAAILAAAAVAQVRTTRLSISIWLLPFQHNATIQLNLTWSIFNNSYVRPRKLSLLFSLTFILEVAVEVVF